MLDDYLDPYDGFIYRRTAQQLLGLNYPDFKTQFLDRCKESANEEYNDYIE